MFIHLMGHTGNYTREEAIAAIDAHVLLPDMLNFDPTRPAQYPNGRVFTDDVINHRLSFLSKGDIPPDGLSAAHRHAARVPLSRHAASGEKLKAHSVRPDSARRKGRQGKHLAHAGRAAQLVRPEAEHGMAAPMGDALGQQQLSPSALPKASMRLTSLTARPTTVKSRRRAVPMLP